MRIQTMIFDLGGVLIDWNPRYLFRKILQDEKEVEYFLKHICTDEWNAAQDAGRPFHEAVTLLQAQHPQYADLIAAYHRRWDETLGEANGETVEILREVKNSGRPVYALTNWSAETFPVARKKFGFLQWFDGIVVSGEEKMKKPDPAIFHLLLERYKIDPGTALYIDDVEANITAARQVGLTAIHFLSARELRKALHQLDLVQHGV